MRRQTRTLARLLLAALALSLMILPSSAFAQRRERQHRTNAYILAGAAALLAHQHDLLTPIALGGAAYETWRMQEDIKNRHRRYRYGYFYPSYSRSRNYYAERHDRGHHYGWYKHGRGHGLDGDRCLRGAG